MKSALRAAVIAPAILLSGSLLASCSKPAEDTTASPVTVAPGEPGSPVGGPNPRLADKAAAGGGGAPPAPPAVTPRMRERPAR